MTNRRQESVQLRNSLTSWMTLTTLVLMTSALMSITSPARAQQIGGTIECRPRPWTIGQMAIVQVLVDTSKFPSLCTGNSSGEVVFKSSPDDGVTLTDRCTVSDIRASCANISGSLGCGCIAVNISHYFVEYNFNVTSGLDSWWTVDVGCIDGPTLSLAHFFPNCSFTAASTDAPTTGNTTSFSETTAATTTTVDSTTPSPTTSTKTTMETTTETTIVTNISSTTVFEGGTDESTTATTTENTTLSLATFTTTTTPTSTTTPPTTISTTTVQPSTDSSPETTEETTTEMITTLITTATTEDTTPSGDAPDCTITQRTRSLTDAAAVGTCSNNTVQCSSTVSSPLNLTLGQNGPLAWTVIQGDPNTDSTLLFDICVTQPLYSFAGQYKVTLRVSNDIGRTSLNLTVTINDVNQAPRFLTQYQQPISVAENASIRSTVAELHVISNRSDVVQGRSDVIYVWDPDKMAGPFTFILTFIESTTTFPNQTTSTTTVANDSAIYLQATGNSQFSFQVRRTLIAGANISIRIQVTDPAGESASGSVLFVFHEVNQPPQCVINGQNITLSVVTAPDTPLYTLPCSDTSNLTYSELAKDGYEYFTVNDSGDVTLEKRVPLDVTRMSYSVRVTDDAGLATDVTLHFVINSNSPPECRGKSGTVTLTQTYEGIQCLNVTLNCSHVPALSSYGLTINYTFTYNTSLFMVQHYQTFNSRGLQHSDSTLQICGLGASINRSVTYDLGLTVSSLTGSSLYAAWRTLQVLYFNQPPRFNQSRYALTLPETAPQGSTVARVVTGTSEADWGSGVTNGVYVLDPDTDQGFALKEVVQTYVEQYQSDGSLVPPASIYYQGIVFGDVYNAFTVNTTLNAGDRYLFVLLARDYAGADASTNVSITVTDVNQPPSCPEPNVSVTVNLTTAVGQTVYDVDCTDPDTDPVFRSLTYSLDGVGAAGSQSYFGINSSTGEVKLTSLLPTDVTHLYYNVTARDGGNLDTYVTFTVVINRDYEPYCSPPSPVNLTFQETDGSGVCKSTSVTCVDTSGRSLPLTFYNFTQGNIVIVDDKKNEANTTEFAACVQGVLPVGQFQMVVEVSNTLRVTSVIFNVTLVDINQPPYFERSTYTVTVPETIAVGNTVAIVRSPSQPQQNGVTNIVRGDPDTVTSSFVITSLMYAVRAEYVNRTEYDVSGGEPIKLKGSDIVVEQSLRPDVVYFCTLTVTDGQGLSANATLELKVDDVNHPPVCRGPFQSPLDLLHPLHTPTLLHLPVVCRDLDYNVTFASLRYFAYPENDASYFNVSENGDVLLVTSVPRDALQLTLNAYVMDGGGLRDNVTLYFNISRYHPPQCTPAYVPPDGVWERDKCFRIYPNCSDPSTPAGDNSYLQYDFTGNWNSAFSQSASPNATTQYAEFCYGRTTDGNYSVRMNVTNGLGDFAWQANIHVRYRNAPPKFTFNRYIAEANETARMGFPLLRVEALVDGRNVSLVYSLTGSSGLNQYFSINNSTGQISVAADLSPLVATQTVGQVTATDPQTGLKHSIPLNIKVLDVNQPPSCSPSSLAANIPWGVRVTDAVATLNCSDPDPSPGFSRLTYSVKGGADMWRSEQSEVRLISRALLEPSRSQYLMTVAASDGVYSATVTVTVIVDMTPPKPVVTVSDVQANSVNLTWTFDDDYLPVINRFTVNVSGTANSPPSQTISKNLRTYVIANLTSQQHYSARVTVNGRGGRASSDDVTFVTPPTAIVRTACTELHLVDEPWTDDLSNNQSQGFRQLQYNLSRAVDQGLQGLRGFVGSTVRSFRRGSVLADVVLRTNQSLTTMTDLKSAVNALVSSGTLAGKPVNSSYSPFYLESVYITGPSVTFTSPGKISNSAGITGYHLVVRSSDVTASCSARTPGAWHPVLEWRLGDSVLRGGRGAGGVEVSDLVRDPSDVFRVTSNLTLRGVTVADSGKLTCRARADQKEKSGHVILRVVERVSAILEPRTAVVTSGSNVTLKCARIAGYDANWTAVFYRLEGSGLKPVDSRQVVQQNSTEFHVPPVTSGLTYQCNITDLYGWALSNEADVIIKPGAAAIQCRKDGKWPTTPAGNTVRLQCPEGYNVTGFEQRTCSAGGQWGNIDTSQCVNQELQGYKNQIESGRTPINTTWKVVGKVANSTSGLLLTGDVITVADILDRVVTVTTETNHEVQTNELQDFVQSASNILQASSEVWLNQTPVALSLVHSVDKIGKVAASNEAISTAPIETDKIVLEVGKAEGGLDDIVFPHPNRLQTYPGWIHQGNSSVFLSKQAFPSNVKDVKYSAVIFRNLTNVFSTLLDETLTGESELFLNSPILAISLQQSDLTILRPVSLTFQHISSNFSSASCQFLNFSGGEEGRWSTSGCRVDVTDSERTVCLCDHLTNFAVLMSPYRPTSTVTDVLNIFSIVGCGVSILCLLLTLIIYRVFWRYVKSDRSIILMNLCVILILAYVTFLAGVNRVQYESVCTGVAALLHYLWLVVFCLMLCEGLDIFISIVIIFPTKSVLLKLLIMAYGVPAVIVGASMGITRLEGYGGEDFCWLSLKNNLLWAFVGPALAALLANFVFVALVIRALLSTTAMITKANRERAKSVVKAICVMTPILGLAWIFGVMAVNDDTLLFQVLFVVFNSLQGLMIFVFHCLMSKQVREGFQQRRRQRSMAKYSGDSNASKYVSQKRTSESSVSSNDLGKSTSPFILADRQVQRMATKMSLLDSPNLLTPDDPPKVAALKDPVAGTTGPGMGEAFLNIQLGEPGNGGPPQPGTPTRGVVGVDSGFRIESGNLSSFHSSSIPSPAGPHPTAGVTTRAVVEKESLRQASSLEDNEQQADIPMLNMSQSRPSGGGRGDQSGGFHRQGQSTAESSSDRDRSRLQKSSRKSENEGPDVGQIVADQQSRLDHVYGAGARVSRHPNPSPSRPYVKGKGGRVVQSAESVAMTSAPKSPAYNNAMPPTSPGDRWIRAAKAIARHHPHGRSPHSPTHHQPPFSQHQPPHPSSPRRLSTSADGMDPSAFPRFSGPRQGEVRYVSGKKTPPPHTAPKPSGWRHHEPPVDYW